MSRSADVAQARDDCFPRVSGDEPDWDALGGMHAVFSSRERR